MGLTAAELAHLLPQLAASLGGAHIQDAARLAERDDLLLFVERDGRRRCLQLVPGGRRGRIAIAQRRFAREEFASGPALDRLAARLRDAQIAGFGQAPGERRCRIELRTADGRLAIELELFGPRGLWCVVDASERILELSRPAQRAGRRLVAGERYAPPPAPPSAPAAGDDPPRFADVAAVDAHYRARDAADEIDELRTHLGATLAAAQRKLERELAGLAVRHEQAARAPELRRQADLLLAFGHAARPGQTELVVPDPERDGAHVVLPLEPPRKPAEQAALLYARARKHEKALAAAAQREQRARAEQIELGQLAGRLANASERAELDAVRNALAARGLIRTAPPPPAPAAKKLTKGENVRRFVSADGLPILVGRSNEQNDRLSLRIANGNDVWLHVGGGRAGSHVVIRLPRGKTAGLETLLDAGTLAVHFSKARGAPACEVIYTHCKHVAKPKGLPPGRVIAHHTRTLQVRLQPERLQRLLASADAPFPAEPPRG